MYEQVRQVPCHRWLFGISIGLIVLAVPHAAVVMVQHLPGALFTLHAVTAGCVGVFAELRRQEWKRLRRQGELRELVAAVEKA